MVHDILRKYILVDGFPHVIDFKKSQGSWFVDTSSGKSYLDCFSQHASQPLGWNHPKVKERVGRLYDVVEYNLANSDFYSDKYAEFVESFAEITSDYKYYFFISGGTLGVENALKAAFDWKCQLTGNDNLDVIHFENAFHGRSGYTLSLTNTTPEKTRYYPKFNWTRCICPAINHGNIETNEDLTLKAVENSLRSGAVAAVIIEPLQSEGGDNHFRKEFLLSLRQLTHQYETMLIFDEVQTGMGTTGKMWCYQHYVTPDMICFGKKVQVCGFASTDRIDSVQNNVFKVSGRINSTWGGNLVDMVRSTIYMEIIKEDNLVDNAREVGSYFVEKLKEVVPTARGLGLMIAFDLQDTEERDLIYKKISEKILCLRCGPKSIRFRPHLDFTKEHADYAVAAVKEVM